jgi:putative glutamine amidotransferase
MQFDSIRPLTVAIPIPSSDDSSYSDLVLARFAAAFAASSTVLRPIPLNEPIERETALCDAIVLPGNPRDINPHRYGQQRLCSTLRHDRARDRVDDALLTHAARTKKPVLAVCHGMQALVVCWGGRLIQHVSEAQVRHSVSEDDCIAHAVEVAPDSCLAGVLGESTSFPVNSRHHQAAEDGPPGLRVVARSPDGIIEAAQGTDTGHFILGVQWHPEALAPGTDGRERPLRAFLTATEVWRRRASCR